MKGVPMAGTPLIIYYCASGELKFQKALRISYHFFIIIRSQAGMNNEKNSVIVGA
jgi:hypothetical protein